MNLKELASSGLARKREKNTVKVSPLTWMPCP